MNTEHAEIKRLRNVLREREREISSLHEAVRELLFTHPAAYRDPAPIDNRTDSALRTALAALIATGGTHEDLPRSLPR